MSFETAVREDNPTTISDAATHQPASSASSQTRRDIAARLASAAVADLQWSWFLPLLLGQIRFTFARPDRPHDIGNAIEAGTTAPSSESNRMPNPLPPIANAMMTSAAVSPEVAAKLGTQQKAEQQFRLAPHEWRSGNEIRVIQKTSAASLIQLSRCTIL